MGPSCRSCEPPKPQWLKKPVLRTLMVKVARSNEGLVDLKFLRGAVLSVPVTTEAFPLTWTPARTALAKFEVGLMADFLNRVEIIFGDEELVVFMLVQVAWYCYSFQFTLAFQRWSLM